MSAYERLSVLVTLVLAGIGLSLFTSVPLIGMLLFVIVLIVLAAGMDMIIRFHPVLTARGSGSRYYRSMFWPLPALLVLVAFWLLRLPIFSGGFAVVVGLALTGILLALIILAEYITVERTGENVGYARTGLNMIAYLVALGLFIVIYAQRWNTLCSAACVAAATAILALDLYRQGAEQRIELSWFYAGITGFMMGEVAVGLSYWPVAAGIENGQLALLSSGLILLLPFYFLSGLSQNYFSGTLQRSVVIEFGTVSIIGETIILAATTWLRLIHAGSAAFP